MAASLHAVRVFQSLGFRLSRKLHISAIIHSWRFGASTDVDNCKRQLGDWLLKRREVICRALNDFKDSMVFNANE